MYKYLVSARSVYSENTESYYTYTCNGREERKADVTDRTMKCTGAFMSSALASSDETASYIREMYSSLAGLQRKISQCTIKVYSTDNLQAFRV